MAATSLHGRLAAELNNEYRHRADALHKHAHLINRFGEAIEPLKLDAHIKPAEDGCVALVAVSTRGRDHVALLAAIEQAGFYVGTPTAIPWQFTDGFEMWTAPVRGHGLEFSLLYYIRAAS